MVYFILCISTFRLFDHYDENHLNETIPKPCELNDIKHWRDVSTAYARFEIYLQQLAKVTVTQVGMNNMLNSEKFWEKRISPNPFKVFIYTVAQLNDQNLKRGAQFRLDLQEFLRLKTPLVDFNQVPKINAIDPWVIR
jgi:hypothetical protein